MVCLTVASPPCIAFFLPGAEMTDISEKLNYDREVVRVWFCNRRQALKNTIKKLKSAE
jgi:class 6 POU domain transcription factor